MQTERLFIQGMTCSGCIDTVTRALRAMDGVHDTDVSLESATAIVQFDKQLISMEELAIEVRRL
ncbi:MAG: heavy-metal-associated domain-containing protein [Wenzhouxiangellaceae bacterium]